MKLVLVLCAILAHQYVFAGWRDQFTARCEDQLATSASAESRRLQVAFEIYVHETIKLVAEKISFPNRVFLVRTEFALSFNRGDASDMGFTSEDLQQIKTEVEQDLMGRLPDLPETNWDMATLKKNRKSLIGYLKRLMDEVSTYNKRLIDPSYNGHENLAAFIERIEKLN